MLSNAFKRYYNYHIYVFKFHIFKHYYHYHHHHYYRNILIIICIYPINYYY